MKDMDRRRFLGNAGLGAAVLAGEWPALAQVAPAKAKDTLAGDLVSRNQGSAIDFRYSPQSWQTAFCFPDDV